MGLKFVENAGGNKMFFCAACYIYLADKAACISTTFTGVSGQAYLFKRAINVSFGPVVLRGMLTGDHYVRDAFCISCKEKIGWMYEMAPTDEERYKEGSIILERLHILEIDAITKSHQLEGRRRVMPGNDDVMHRVREAQRQRIAMRQEAERERLMNNVFRFHQGRPIPVVTLFDEVLLAQALELNQHMVNLLKNDLRRLNQAIRSYSRGNTMDLWQLGFRADYARQFREISDIMEGEPYRPSVQADRNLVSLLQRMVRERERMRLYAPEPNNGRPDFDEWVVHNADLFREPEYLRRRRHYHPMPRNFADEIFRQPARQIGQGPNNEMLDVENEEVQQDIALMLHLEGLLVVNENLARQQQQQP